MPNHLESLGNPSCFEQHFVSNLSHRTIVAGNGEILQSRTIQDRIQLCHPSNILRLQDARLSHLQPLSHGSNVRGETANDRVRSRNGPAATFQCGTVLYRARHQESPYSEGSIVPADRLKIAVHHNIVACARRQMRKPKRIKVESRVGYVLQCQDVRRFAQNAALARSHRTRNDEQRFSLHWNSIIPSITALTEN